MYYVERKQADNPSTAVDLLIALATHRYPTVRGNVAGNPSAPISSLWVLARDRDEWIRSRVAKNACTPRSVLLELATDTSALVRLCVAKHPATCDKALMKLISPDVDNRKLWLAYHTDLQQGEQCCYDYAWRSIDRTELAGFSTGNEIEDIRLTILCRENIPAPVLEAMVACGSSTLRRAVAKRPDLSCSLIKILLNDSDDEVSRRATCCPAFGVASELPSVFDYVDDNSLLSKLAGVCSKKRVCKLLFGTQHAEEVRFVFDKKNRNCWEGLKHVQNLFLNSKGKTDRFTYLQFLAVYSSSDCDLSHFFDHDSETLTWIIRLVGWREVLDFFAGQDQGLAIDSLYLLSAAYRRTGGEANDRAIDLIDGGLSRHRVEELHARLLDMEFQSKNEHPSQPQVLWQQTLLANLNSAVSLLPDGVTLYFPTCSSELPVIGREQRHCVGIEKYKKRCIAGDSIIFSFELNGSLKHGETFEFSGNTGELIQAAGVCNAKVPLKHRLIAVKVFECLSGKPV